MGQSTLCDMYRKSWKGIGECQPSLLLVMMESSLFGVLVLGLGWQSAGRRGQKEVNSHASPVPHCLHMLSHFIFIATAWHSDISLLDKEPGFRKVEWPTQVRPTASRKVVEPKPKSLWLQSSRSFPHCMLPHPDGKPPNGPPSTGRKSHHASHCKSHMRETIRINISFYQKIFLRPQPISIHFKVHPAHQISSEDRNFGWIVMGFWNPVFTG